MSIPLFEKSLHYSDADIAWVTKVFGFGLALVATFFSAVVVRKLGIMRSLLFGTVAGSASHLSLAWLAAHGSSFWDFTLAVGIDGFAYAFAQMVLITFMSTIVSKEMAAGRRRKSVGIPRGSTRALSSRRKDTFDASNDEIRVENELTHGKSDF